MVPPFDHLWGQVVERTAERLPPRVGRVDAPAKVGDFQLTLDADEEVLGLDVAVNHVLLVAVRQRPGERRDVGGGALLAEPLSLLELLVQLTAGGVLEDQVHAVLFDWWVSLSILTSEMTISEFGIYLLNGLPFDALHAVGSLVTVVWVAPWLANLVYEETAQTEQPQVSGEADVISA